MSDTLKRVWSGDVAQCGCRWVRRVAYGDLLVLCPVHRAANRAQFEKYERERGRLRQL